MLSRRLLHLSSEFRDFLVSPKERHLRLMAFQWYSFCGIVVFLILAVVARFVPYFSIDLYITQEFQEPRSIPLYPLLYAISWIGYMPQFPIIIGFISLIIFLLGLRWEGVVALIAGGGSALFGAFIKEFINRPRPSVDLVTVLHHLSDTSFPSGHTLTYTTFFGFLWLLTYVLMKSSWHRNIVLVVFSLIIILVGPSRIFLGEHWASDVFGGYLLGSICLLITIYFYRWGKRRFFMDQPIARHAS
jgi:membrane-associated phospholipid phosphatase